MSGEGLPPILQAPSAETPERSQAPAFTWAQLEYLEKVMRPTPQALSGLKGMDAMIERDRFRAQIEGRHYVVDHIRSLLMEKK